MLLTIIGLALGLYGRGWMILLIGIGCCIVGITLGNIPKVYLASFVKLSDESITAKDATKIVEKHLQDRESKDTVYFLADFDYEVRQKKKNNQR